MANSNIAFNYQPGQFICHVHVKLLESEHEIVEDIVDRIESEQRKRYPESCDRWWKALVREGDDGDSHELHITLLRGHRAVYYHQIKSLVSLLERSLKVVSSFCLCLDKLVVFSNHENSKEFLSLASSQDKISGPNDSLKKLKQIIQQCVDEFAIKLTEEDETGDTVAHCSIMSRKVANNFEASKDSFDLIELNNLFAGDEGDLLVCLVKIDRVNIKIGNHIYEIKLATQ